VGSDGVPKIPLPRTVLSNVDTLTGAGGVIQESPDNLTLYNSVVTMRLLGGTDPHDLLLGKDRRVLNSRLFWGIEANVSSVWTPLLPSLNVFNIIGTNRTGTYILRTMAVGEGVYLGTLKIAYQASTEGPLRWDLDFTPAVAGDYRLVYTWLNTSTVSELRAASKTFSVRYGLNNYDFSWSDVPSSLNVSSSTLGTSFKLSIDLGRINANSRIAIDPSIVSSTTYTGAIDYQFQRKIFRDSTGRYFVFYYNGSSLYYASSLDGVTWSPRHSMPPGWPAFVDAPTSLPSVAYYGGNVVVAAGDYVSVSNGTRSIVSAGVHYATGTISGSSIMWRPTQTVNATTYNCGPFGCFGNTFGVRYVYAMLDSNGDIGFSYNAYNTTGVSDQYESVGLSYLRGSSTYTALIESYSTCNSGPGTGVVVPEGDPSNGVVRVIYDRPTSSCAAVFQLDSVTYSSISRSLGAVDSGIALFSYDPFKFSVASDAEYNTHLVYFGYAGGGSPVVGYVYHSPGSSWTAPVGVFANPQSGNPLYGSITVDLSTDTVYALGFFDAGQNPQGGEFFTIVMTSKSPGQDPAWHDSIESSQFKNRVLDAASSLSLGTPLAFASWSTSNSLPLVWREGYNSANYNVAFGAIPIQTVWSPYAFPSAPWDGNGIAPYGQYFHSLDESVSASNGELTIAQTDLSVPGRGLNLEITRVFISAYSSYNQMDPLSTPAPIGAGWGLNFPIYDSTNHLVHLWNGMTYSLPTNWLAGCFPRCTWENHQGENFRIIQNSDYTVDLITKSGITYHFGANNPNPLLTISDATGNNAIVFGYNQNRISTITDTVGRTFLFCYNGNNYVSSIEQVAGGSCGTEVGLVRRVSYSYIGWPHLGQPYSLASVTDPAGRVTQFQYNAVPDVYSAPFIISRMVYPTNWYSNYTYILDSSPSWYNSPSVYRASQQIVYSSSGSIIRQFAYTYSHDPNNGQMVGATVTAFNGTSTASYTDYSFSYAGVKWNVSDASHRLVRGVIQLFGVHGEVPQEIVLVTDGSGQSGLEHIGSYTNYYRYDFWGDLIYSHTVINPSTKWYHDNFNAYYNNGLPPGFNAFQESFSQLNGTFSDNPWLTYNGTWRVRNGVYNGTAPIFNPAHQEGFFAWTNFTSPNISIIASIYVTKPMVSSDGRVGLIAHYPGNGMRKWALVLHNSTGGVKLSLLDEYVAWRMENPCTLNYNSWYRFNFTISAKQAWGTATAPGVSCSVSGSFTSNDITLSTGLGLYAGGYSALFDNVTVTTVAPSITGTSFSNSFIQGGSPSSNVKGALAGRAELQNGTGTLPIETYYSYWSWGGLNQVKNRYDPAGGTQWISTSRTYDSYGNPATIVDPRGNYTYLNYPVKYQYAYLTNETQVLKPGSTKITRLYGYDSTAGTLLWAFDPNGHNITYTYDNLGRLTTVAYLTPNSSQLLANPGFETGDFTGWSQTGMIIRADYVRSGRFSAAPSYNPSSQIYSAYTLQRNFPVPISGSLVTSIQLWYIYGYPYNAVDFAQVLYSDGTYSQTSLPEVTVWTLQSLSFDNTKQIVGLKIVRPSGQIYNVVFDDFFVSPTVSNGDTVAYHYNDNLDYVDVNNENGWKTRLVYDGLGRLGTTDRFLGSNSYSNTTATHDYRSNTLSLKDALNNVYYYTYDALGRLASSTRPDGKSTSQLYNDLASWSNSTNQDHNARCSYYDRLGRLISIVEYADPGCNARTLNGLTYVTKYYYDEVGNLRKVTNAAGKSTSYSYDNLNRLTLASYPDGTTETYSYDNNGNLVRKLDRANIKTLSSYDSLNRISAVTYCGATIIGTTYTYDRNSNPLQILNQNATVSYIYDSRNRMLNETYVVNSPTRTIVDLGCSGSGGNITRTGGVAKTYTLGWTFNGELLNTLMYPTISVNNPDITVKYSYDGLGRVLNVTNQATSAYFARSFTYYKSDQVKGFQFGNNLIQNYTYDSLSRPSTITLTGTTTMSLAYAYNNTGTVARVTGFVNAVTMNETYRYDPFQRLTNSTLKSSGSTTTSWYEYDNLGNRVRQKLNSTITRYAYNSVNELTNSTTYSTPQTTIAYSYDPNGNLKTQNVTNVGTVRWTYTWDAANRLLKATNGTGQARYAYDGVGRMLESIEGSSTWFLAYSGTEILYRNLLNQNNQAYVSAAGIKLVRVVDRTAMYYYHTDALGSTRMITYNDATYVFIDNYQPFGKDNGTPKGSLANTEKDRFTGKPFSSATGLYYDYQRWYDPSVGRFISADPFRGHRSNPQSLNSYGYVRNMPTSATDPAGLDGGFGADNRCEKLHQCGTINGAESIEVAKDALIFAGVVTLGVVVCILACAEVAAALGIICLADEPGCQGAADTLVKDVLDLGSKDAVDVGSKDSIDVITKTGGDALVKGGGDAIVRSTTDDFVDTSAFWRITENGGYDLERTEIHHLLPRQFQAFFRSNDLGIDDYTVQLDRGVHSVLHGRGGSYFGSWNGLWKGFIWNNQNADESEVLEFLGMMLEDFGF